MPVFRFPGRSRLPVYPQENDISVAVNIVVVMFVCTRRVGVVVFQRERESEKSWMCFRYHPLWPECGTRSRVLFPRIRAR